MDRRSHIGPYQIVDGLPRYSILHEYDRFNTGSTCMTAGILLGELVWLVEGHSVDGALTMLPTLLLLGMYIPRPFAQSDTPTHTGLSDGREMPVEPERSERENLCWSLLPSGEATQEPGASLE